MSEQEERRDSSHRPPVPDRRGLGPGTWGMILFTLAATAMVILWAANTNLP